MRKTLVALLAVSLMFTVMGVPAAANAVALGVDEIFIAQRKDHWANVVTGFPYNFEVWVNGTGITSVSVMDPYGVSHSLVLEDGQWDFEEVGFASLADLDASYGPGDYVFNFNSGADTVTINYQYTEPTDFAYVTNPTDGQTDVALNPVYRWNSVEGYGDVLTLAVENPGGLGPDLYSEGPVFDMTTTSWQPGPLADHTAYEFQIAVSKLQDGTPQGTATTGADDFTYYGLFDYVNRVGFTVPEPATLGMLLLGGLGLVRRCRPARLMEGAKK